MASQQTVIVRDRYNTYTASMPGQKMRASATAGPYQAACALANKIWPDQPVSLVAVNRAGLVGHYQVRIAVGD